jgi:hypothetical protein
MSQDFNNDTFHHTPPVNLPENPLVQKIILLLNYLAAEHEIPHSGDEILFELLHTEWFNIPHLEIAKLSIEVADRRFGANKISLRGLLYEKVNTPPRELFTPPVHEGLKMASGLIEKLVAIAPGVSLPFLLENTFRETGLEDYILKRHEKAALLEAMTGLHNINRYPPPAHRHARKEAGEKLLKPEISKLDEDIESRLLKRFVMNVTALNNYLRCPLEFYFRNLVRIPSPGNEATEFGSAVHQALECLFRKMQSDHETFPSKAFFIAGFEEYMHSHRAAFTREQFQRRINHGRDVLSNYYDEYIHAWNRIVAVERNIRIVLADGIPLKGKIDKLEFDGWSVNIVDYKTGDPEKARAKLAPPDDNKPSGGDYWRQAVFYKILVDNYQQKEWKVASIEFDFIEPDKNKRYHKEKRYITPADITTVTQQITTAWEQIQNHQFYTGCGKPDCYWCHFVKTNHLAAALHE